VTVSVTNFDLQAKYGQANAPGQGHIHYFMDVTPPTAAGKAAVTDAGTWTNTTATSYTWHNVGGGAHTFSVELVNNDHTPLAPPVTATVNVLVIPNIGPPAMVILSPRDGANITGSSITVNIQAANFNIVNNLSGTNVSNQGHVHYFLDVNPVPATAGQPAIPASASAVWSAVPDSTYTFTNVTPGNHTIAVELVNNDHTALTPPVVQQITVTVAAATSTTTTSSSSTATTSTQTTTSSQPAVSINLTAQNMAFNMSTITVSKGAQVTINFNNMDSGVIHNFSVYQTGSGATGVATGPIFNGPFVTGPAATVYKFTAPSAAGTYFFRCDVHPTTMFGSFVVQ
jgi:plastocyanin